MRLVSISVHFGARVAFVIALLSFTFFGFVGTAEAQSCGNANVSVEPLMRATLVFDASSSAYFIIPGAHEDNGDTVKIRLDRPGLLHARAEDGPFTISQFRLDRENPAPERVVAPKPPRKQVSMFLAAGTYCFDLVGLHQGDEGGLRIRFQDACELGDLPQARTLCVADPL